jgi:hypothetical protein
LDCAGLELEPGELDAEVAAVPAFAAADAVELAPLPAVALGAQFGSMPMRCRPTAAAAI